MARPRKPKGVPIPHVDPTAFKRITEAMVEIDAQKSELGSDRSEYSKEARENMIHAKAHSWIVALLKMMPADRHLCLECFDAYRAIMKLDAWQSAEDPQSDIEDVAKAKAA
jgi:hypothetical protein